MALSTSVRKRVEGLVQDASEDGESSFQSIEALQQVGINAADIMKLKDEGYCTELCNVKGLSDVKVEKILAACKKLNVSGFVTGSEFMKLRDKVIQITTGSQELDTLLGGGIETMSITEVFGEFRTGKTQLGHTLCVTTQLPSELKGANGKVIFIDTEGTLYRFSAKRSVRSRPSRITEIAKRFGLNPGETLDNILLARAYTHEHQMEILHAVAQRIVEDESAIIDSITALFRADFSGRGELSERQQKLNKHLSTLKKICEEFNIAVYIVNQFVQDAKKPIGGNILAHASTTRIYLKKGKGINRIAKIYDSPNLPENEVTFAITVDGIVDSE